MTEAAPLTAPPLAVHPPAGSDPDVARWVAAAQRGDRDAALRLITRFRPPLVRLLRGIAPDLAEAEDLAQEALVEAFRSLGQLRDPARFYPWLRRLAVRRAVRHTKRADPPAAAAEPPESPADQAELRVTVRQLLSLLHPDLRAVLVLREIEELDYREIAAELGIPVGTVRSRLHAARERFRRLWRHLESGE